MRVLNSVAEAIHKKGLQMRQVISLLDIHKNGFIQRAELSQVIRGIYEPISLEDARLMLTFFDEKGTGKIQVTELVACL